MVNINFPKPVPSAPPAPAQDAVPPDPGNEDALEQISFYLGRAYYNYVALLERTMAELGLDRHLCPGMGHILFALFKEDDRIIKDIARQVSLSQSTLTGMLARMERAGVIERRRDADDGRAVRVRLTALGRSLEPRCWRALDMLNRVLRAGMSEEEIQQTKHGLAHMIAAMRREEESRPPRRARQPKGGQRT